MINEILIEPIIYHGPGGCRICGGPVVVIDTEMTIMKLNQEGHPISEETSSSIRAVCSHCGEKQKMMRWQGGYVPYGYGSCIERMFELREAAKNRVEQLNQSSKENPLAL